MGSSTLIEGRSYALQRGSDIIRDGMFLELHDRTDADGECLAEIFYSDQTNDMVFTAFKEDLPLPAVEWLIAQARALLPPRAD
ncbi:MAG: hypothetical protein K0R27_4346 [Xanthobacteraceae bacterium]|jgi:hypothetical protein|nr:hypothetical protein [Xanthobacteraceae bacterium]